MPLWGWTLSSRKIEGRNELRIRHDERGKIGVEVPHVGKWFFDLQVVTNARVALAVRSIEIGGVLNSRYPTTGASGRDSAIQERKDVELRSQVAVGSRLDKAGLRQQEAKLLFGKKLVGLTKLSSRVG